MGLLDKFKKKEPVYVDPRIMEKIEQSDLLEYLEGQRKIGKNVDLFYGKKIPKDDPLMYFLTQLTALNSGIVSRKTFEYCGFTESEINAIMGKFDTKMGLSHPSRCVKDLVWHYMFQKEFERLSSENGDEKFAKKIEQSTSTRRVQEKWLDWDRAIEEFWMDESEKDYRSYIITK